MSFRLFVWFVRISSVTKYNQTFMDRQNGYSARETVIRYLCSRSIERTIYFKMCSTLVIWVHEILSKFRFLSVRWFGWIWILIKKDTPVFDTHVFVKHIMESIASLWNATQHALICRERIFAVIDYVRNPYHLRRLVISSNHIDKESINPCRLLSDACVARNRSKTLRSLWPL